MDLYGGCEHTQLRTLADKSFSTSFGVRLQQPKPLAIKLPKEPGISTAWSPVRDRVPAKLEEKSGNVSLSQTTQHQYPVINPERMGTILNTRNSCASWYPYTKESAKRRHLSLAGGRGRGMGRETRHWSPSRRGERETANRTEQTFLLRNLKEKKGELYHAQLGATLDTPLTLEH